MADQTLTLDAVQALYADFDLAQISGWQRWYDAALAEVSWAQALSIEELASPAAQQRLWSLRGISTLGVGENINVSAIVVDPEIVQLLCSLRDRHWPSQVGKRAHDVQAVYGQLIEKVAARVEGNRPKAKLHRAMFALLPRELHVGFSWDSHRMIRKLLIGQPQAKKLQAAVLVRERLRQALGPEESVEEDLRRSLFLWWVFENGESLLETGKPKPGAEKTPTAVEDVEAEILEPLALLPYGKQYKGMFVISGMLDGVRDVVQATMGGRTRDELVELLRTEYGYTQWSPKTARAVIGRLLGLGLLKREDGLYAPSDEGDRFLEDEPSAFIETMFVRVYGFAQAQRAIANKALTIGEVAEGLRSEYPKWTSDWMASDLLKWGAALGLSKRDGSGAFLLTSYGSEWVARLPEILPKPPPDAFQVVESDGPMAPEVVSAAPHPTFQKVWAAFQQPPHNRLIFSRAQVRALHAAWTFHPRKRFAILSGLSGTGKTELLLTYSHIVSELMGLDTARQVRRVAVGPDWRDPTGLLGYFNALHAEPTFQAEPALRIVLDAVANPDVPFFLILDEMNLARVERYFAPFLSAMESDKDPWIQLHAHDDPINEVPPQVPWPANLRIGGTVNMDETTHPFSDKVLDRAFTLEFWEVDLPTFFSRRPERTAEDREVETVLLGVQAVLLPIRRHFGYRSAGEVLAWVGAARASDPSASLAACMDQALFSKVLPRLRGSQTARLESALKELAELFEVHKMPMCSDKAATMHRRLLATGVTGFWS